MAKVYLPILVRGTLNKKKVSLHFSHLTSSRTHGFTLLELLIVIVIISVLFTFVSLTIRSSSPEEQIKKEAERLHRLVQLALEEAVLKNTEYGLEFKQTSYRFLTFKDDKWQVVEGDKLFRQRVLPNDMEIELSVEQNDIVIGETTETNSSKKAKPQVFLLSSEEITPEFSAHFTLHGVETSYILKASSDGKNEVKASDY